MANIVLRPYQQDFIDNVRNEFRSLLREHKKPAVVGVAPCGAGKTIMTGWMIKEAAERGKRSIFFVHRRELIQQTADAFTNLNIPFGIIAANHKMNLDFPVQIASVQTLARRLDFIPEPDFLVCDECHHILAETYKKIVDAFPDAFLLGVTATPLRMGDISLADSFNSMVVSLNVNQLIDLGNLTKFRYFVSDINLDLSDVPVERGDFNNDKLAEVINNSVIIGDVVDCYLKHAAGKSAICYCVNIAHSKAVADAFNRAGIVAEHCDGSTPKWVRQRIVNRFKQGLTKILCNAELFGEGFDVPNMQAVILARPTQSLTLYIQQALRPLRPDPNDPDKVAIIIDHVRNYARHGLPNDFHDWNLNPNVKRKKRAANLERHCPHCHMDAIPGTNSDGDKFCTFCGFVFEKQEREITHIDGVLEEISVSFDDNSPSEQIKKVPDALAYFIDIAERKNYKKAWVVFRAAEYASSYDDFLQIANFAGYKPGWAYFRWRDLQDKLANGPLRG